MIKAVMVVCPVCRTKLDSVDNDKDYLVIAHIMQAHIRHNHIGCYDNLFSRIERNMKIHTYRYKEIKREANKKARDILIKALLDNKPTHYKEILKSLYYYDIA